MYTCFLYKFQSPVGHRLSHVTHPTHVLFPHSRDDVQNAEQLLVFLRGSFKGHPATACEQGPEGFSAYLAGLGRDVDCSFGGAWREAHQLALMRFHILMVGIPVCTTWKEPGNWGPRRVNNLPTTHRIQEGRGPW